MSEAHRPLITFALFAYNQERYIREAVKGALSQDYSPLEIIISDDFSSDQTFTFIREVISSYTGHHRIIINRNEHNLGLIGHINKIVSISSGSLIVVAAGDDISLSSRTTTLAKIFHTSCPEPLLIHSQVEKISSEGIPLGLKNPPLKTCDSRTQIKKASTLDAVYIGASGAWNRKLFEAFGPIKEPAAYEDIVLGTRAAMMGGIIYCSTPLVRYRTGTGITTNADRFQNMGSFFKWRRNWLKSMVAAYTQRVYDAENINFQKGMPSIKRRLDSFLSKKMLYGDKKELIRGFKSTPIYYTWCFISEAMSITAILLYRAWFILRNQRPASQPTSASNSRR